MWKRRRNQGVRSEHPEKQGLHDCCGSPPYERNHSHRSVGNGFVRSAKCVRDSFDTLKRGHPSRMPSFSVLAAGVVAAEGDFKR